MKRSGDIPGTYKQYFCFDATYANPGGSGSTWNSYTIRTDPDSPFDIVKIVFSCTSDSLKVKLQDESNGIYLTRGQSGIDIKDIGGKSTLPIGLANSFIPYILPTPYRLGAGSNFTVQQADYSGATNTLRMTFHGYKFITGTAPWAQRDTTQDMPFIVGFDNGVQTLAANGSTSQNIVMANDGSCFLVTRITGIRTGAALISLGEDARGRSWTNTPIYFDNLIGNGSFPNILPAPRFLAPGSIVVANIQDLSGNSNVIDVQLHGIKMFGIQGYS